jgi:hypothetical protein
MSRTKKKYIGINQRIPFDVLDAAIDNYVSLGSLDKEDILSGIKNVTLGSNRANKAALYARQILTRQTKVLDLVSEHYPSYRALRSDEKRALSLCLICLTYPIVYDLLVAMAQGLKVQDVVNKKFMTSKISALYGSNRTVDVAMDAIIPMIIELGVVDRKKMGLYGLGKKLVIRKPILLELLAFTDASVQGTKSLLLDNLMQKPWYTYFEVEWMDLEKPSVMFERKDSHAGRGYLTLKSLP